jgi:hypothetical protein
MNRYETTASSSPATSSPASTPVAITTLAGAAGAGLAILVLLTALDVRWNVTWRVSAVTFALVMLVAAAGAFRRVARYAFERLEQAVGFDLNADGHVGGPDIRLVPVRSATTVGVERGMDVEDLRYMISCLDYEHQRGWTVREWLNERLPSGREIVAADVGPYAEFIRILERIGALVDRSERSKGRLIMPPAEIMRRLGL